MATSKINVGIGIALMVAGAAVVVLLFLPSAPVEAPSTPSDNEITTPGTPSQTESEAEAAPIVTTPAEYNDIIRVSEPLPESTISSPLTIEGETRGTWFFEGSFPIVLTNWDGLIIAEGYATAEGEWMTEDYVPFTADLTFTADTTVSDRATLILQKSNPSGLPENDDAFEYNLFFE